MARKISLLLSLVALLSCCLAPAVSAETVGDEGLLFVVLSSKDTPEHFFYLSQDSSEKRLSIRQLAADQEFSLPDYQNHRTGTGTLKVAYELGVNWGSADDGIAFATAAAVAQYGIAPKYTLVLSSAGLDNILDLVFQEHHVLSPDALAAFGRILIEVQAMDAQRLDALAVGLATEAISDADEDALSTFIPAFFQGTGEYTIALDAA